RHSCLRPVLDECCALSATLCFSFFFFQAEDGIRDWSVTGVQTCALPIYAERRPGRRGRDEHACEQRPDQGAEALDRRGDAVRRRSEERRVGKECRCRWAPYTSKKRQVDVAWGDACEVGL